MNNKFYILLITCYLTASDISFDYHITSKLNTTNLKIVGQNLLVLTEGGMYYINEKKNDYKYNKLEYYDSINLLYVSENYNKYWVSYGYCTIG